MYCNSLDISISLWASETAHRCIYFHRGSQTERRHWLLSREKLRPSKAPPGGWWGRAGVSNRQPLQTEPKIASGDWSTRSRSLAAVVFLRLLAKPACCSAGPCRESHVHSGARIRSSDALGGIRTTARAHAPSSIRRYSVRGAG